MTPIRAAYVAASGKVYRSFDHTACLFAAQDKHEPEVAFFPYGDVTTRQLQAIEARMGFWAERRFWTREAALERFGIANAEELV